MPLELAYSCLCSCLKVLVEELNLGRTKFQRREFELMLVDPVSFKPSKSYKPIHKQYRLRCTLLSQGCSS